MKTIDGTKVNILYRESPWIEENNSKETYNQLKGYLRPLNEYEKEPAMESFALDGLDSEFDLFSSIY